MILGCPLFLFPSGVQVTGDQFPPSSHGDDFHALLLASGKEFMIGYGVGIIYSPNYSQTLGMDGRQLSDFTFGHPPTF